MAWLLSLPSRFAGFLVRSPSTKLWASGDMLVGRLGSCVNHIITITISNRQKPSSTPWRSSSFLGS